VPLAKLNQCARVLGAERAEWVPFTAERRANPGGVRTRCLTAEGVEADLRTPATRTRYLIAEAVEAGLRTRRPVAGNGPRPGGWAATVAGNHVSSAAAAALKARRRRGGWGCRQQPGLRTGLGGGNRCWVTEAIETYRQGAESSARSRAIVRA
jgi:hypothetical protein